MSFLLAFRWVAIGEELVQRPFITVGFAAYVILLALGITSPQFMVRKLGKSWKKLHRLIYAAAILGLIHLLWILRTDVGEAALYGLIVAVLLGFRVVKSRKKAIA
jgi:sulfoxide reductase heme-binding subunit YedZ